MFVENVHGLSREEILKSFPSVYSVEPAPSRSANYKFIPTYEIIDALAQNGFGITYVAQAKARSSENVPYTKHLLRFRKFEDMYSTEEETPEIAIINSHNGASAYDVIIGFIRWACLNGCFAGTIGDRLKAYHKGNVLETIVNLTIEKAKHSDELMTIINQMKKIELTSEDALLLAEYALQIRFGKKAKTNLFTPESFLQVRIQEDAANTLYNIYQRLQTAGIRGGVNGFNSRYNNSRISRSISNIGHVVKYNEELWKASVDMMNIKLAK